MSTINLPDNIPNSLERYIKDLIHLWELGFVKMSADGSYPDITAKGIEQIMKDKSLQN